MSSFDLVPLLQRVCSRYPGPARLTERRLTQTIYLIDWRSSIVRGRQVTDIKWQFHDFGPWSPDVIQTVLAHPEIFRVRSYTSIFGEERKAIGLTKRQQEVRFTPEIEEIVNFILDNTNRLETGAFLDLVYLTFPIATFQGYPGPDDTLNLVELARRRSAALDPSKNRPRSKTPVAAARARAR